jgi:C4-dicarboxylate-specific signal transduction histidine kinase
LRINTLNNIGNIHYWAHDFESAHNCFLRALEEADKIDFPYGKSLSLASMGDLLIKQERVDEGLIFLKQAIELRKKTNNIHGLIHDLHSIAGAYMGNNDLQEAETCLEQARSLAKENNYKRLLASILLSYAELYKLRNEQENQIALLEECIGYATAENYRDTAANALRELAQAYEERRELKKALKSYWQYQEIKNYLIDENKNLSIHQLRMQMEVAEREREMALIRKTNLTLEKKNRQINRQQSKLEIADEKLRYWNSELEQRVREEVAKQQQQQQLLIQKSKLESLGRLAAGIAHEINQPLGMISLGIQNLLDQLETGILDIGYIEKKAHYFNENLNRIRKIIEHVRLFSRDQQDDTVAKTDLIEIVQNALSMISLQCKNQSILLDFEHPHRAVYILANKYRVEQVVLNLLSNAQDAIEERFDRFHDQKRIAIYLKSESGKIALRIRDNGVGISEELKQQIFDPFFSTKSENKGTGLGLSICYGIVNDLGGNIACESTLETGTTMTVEFPDLFSGD